MPQREAPLGLVRTVRKRTWLALGLLAGIFAGLLTYASLSLAHGAKPPAPLLAISPRPANALTTPRMLSPGEPPELLARSQAPSSISPQAYLPSLADLIREDWQASQDPPLPSYDPYAEMEQSVASGSPTFDGRPLRAVKTIRMRVTAYSPDERSCGKWADGVTASGYSVYTNGMKLVAADTRLLPFGTIVSIPGYHGGRPVPVLDRGGLIKGRRLDVLYPTHEIARRWGVQDLEVTVWDYAD